MSHKQAFVTLCCNDEYAPGALVWAQSLRNVQTHHDIVVMVTPNVTPRWREVLQRVADHLETVNVLDSKDESNLRLLQRMELGITFTKLHCWRLTQYSKAVFMDADTLVVQNIDDLFARDELSAASDPGWPDCFNSGVFVYRPSQDTYKKLMDYAFSQRSFDGGDQGLLNMYFSEWFSSDISRRLPFIYNCICQTFYTYAPALAHFRSQVRVVHFIGADKPWRQNIETINKQEAHEGSVVQFLQLWWRIYTNKVQIHLDDSMKLAPHIEASGHFNHSLQAGAGGDHASATTSGPVGPQLSDRERQYAWERGEIDYTGSDRFSNILEKLSVNMHEDKEEKKETSPTTTPTRTHPSPPKTTVSTKKASAKK
jgi:glycogenin glucosyltransferase